MTDKLVPVKVKVNQPGFPEALCSYIKGQGDRGDLFLVNQDEKDADIFVVTPDVVEALGRKEKSHVGVISSSNGEILIPLENSEIIKTRDDIYIVVGGPTTLEVKNAISARDKGDFSKVSEFESAKEGIVSRMKSASSDVQIVFSDPFREARTYKIKMNTNGVYCVEPLSLPASYIGIDDVNVYSHSNILNGSLKTIAYSGNKKTDEVVAFGIEEKPVVQEDVVTVPTDKEPDKIEMPTDVKSPIEVSTNTSVETLNNNAPTYDKLFSTLDKARGENRIEMSVNPSMSSPSNQLDEINFILKQFAANNPTDRLRKELRELRAERDKLRQDLADSLKTNKELTGKCTDYQNDLYAERAINKDLKDKVVQLKETTAEMKSRLSQQEINFKETSAKLAQTVAIISSFVNEGQEVKEDVMVKAA